MAIIIKNIINKAIIDYVESRISFDDLKSIVNNFDMVEIYDQLKKDKENDIWALIDMISDEFLNIYDKSGNTEKSIFLYYKKITKKTPLV